MRHREIFPFYDYGLLATISTKVFRKDATRGEKKMAEKVSSQLKSCCENGSKKGAFIRCPFVRGECLNVAEKVLPENFLLILGFSKTLPHGLSDYNGLLWGERRRRKKLEIIIFLGLGNKILNVPKTLSSPI